MRIAAPSSKDLQSSPPIPPTQAEHGGISCDAPDNTAPHTCAVSPGPARGRPSQPQPSAYRPPSPNAGRSENREAHAPALAPPPSRGEGSIDALFERIAQASPEASFHELSLFLRRIWPYDAPRIYSRLATAFIQVAENLNMPPKIKPTASVERLHMSDVVWPKLTAFCLAQGLRTRAQRSFIDFCLLGHANPSLGSPEYQASVSQKLGLYTYEAQLHIVVLATDMVAVQSGGFSLAQPELTGMLQAAAMDYNKKVVLAGGSVAQVWKKWQDDLHRTELKHAIPSPQTADTYENAIASSSTL